MKFPDTSLLPFFFVCRVPRPTREGYLVLVHITAHTVPSHSSGSFCLPTRRTCTPFQFHSTRFFAMTTIVRRLRDYNGMNGNGVYVSYSSSRRNQKSLYENNSTFSYFIRFSSDIVSFREIRT